MCFVACGIQTLLFLLGPLCAVAVWPLPQSQVFGSGNTQLCSTFAFSMGTQSNAILQRAFARYANLTSRNRRAGAQAGVCIDALVVTMTDPSTVQVLPGMDESYTLTVGTGTTATLSTSNFVGALRGLETFSQLLVGPGSATLPLVTVQDSPRFPWRGIMIDTARHYLPISVMLRLLDAMSFVKLNTLHIHFVDAESWPLVVPSWPGLAGAGAYSADATFTAAQLQQGVAYATDRGIRVVPETDMPGFVCLFLSLCLSRSLSLSPSLSLSLSLSRARARPLTCDGARPQLCCWQVLSAKCGQLSFLFGQHQQRASEPRQRFHIQVGQCCGCRARVYFY